MLQLLFLILTTAGIYLLIGNSFAILYSASKIFNLSHAALITFSAYFSYFFIVQLQFDKFLSFLLSIFITVAIGLVFECFIFRLLRKKNATSLSQLILSLGLYIVLQNIISIVWGNDLKSISNGSVNSTVEFVGTKVTNIQILIITISIILFCTTILFLSKTKLGRKIKAVSSNRDLSMILGINIDYTLFATVVISSGLAAIAGILISLDTNMNPQMGFNLLIYGIVAMIIGGVNSHWGLLGGAILLSCTQHIGAYYIDNKWMDTIAYIVLILFLIWKPLGFSGKQLKKVEI